MLREVNLLDAPEADLRSMRLEEIFRQECDHVDQHLGDVKATLKTHHPPSA